MTKTKDESSGPGVTLIGAARALAASALIFLVASSAAKALEIAPFARGTFAQIRKAHEGKPLVVHFWSVTCPVCVGELAEWGKISREDRGFDLVIVNTDPPKDRARVAAKLEKAGLGEAANYAFADDFAERLYFDVDRNWRGELPFNVLVDADGEMETSAGPFDDPEVAAWLGARQPPKTPAAAGNRQ
jgi:hypothetical protein